jgi:hypothetical protein
LLFDEWLQATVKQGLRHFGLKHHIIASHFGPQHPPKAVDEREVPTI